MERWRSCGSTVCSIGAFAVTLQRQGSAKSPASKGFNSGTGSVAASGAVGTGDADGMAGAGGSFAAGAFGAGVDLRGFALAFLGGAGGALMLGAGVTSDATGVSSTGASGTGAGLGEGASLEKTRSWVGVGMGAREKCSSKRFTRSPFEPSWSSGHSRVPVS